MTVVSRATEQADLLELRRELALAALTEALAAVNDGRWEAARSTAGIAISQIQALALSAHTELAACPHGVHDQLACEVCNPCVGGQSP